MKKPIRNIKLLQPIYVALPFKPFGARGIMLFPFAFYKPYRGEKHYLYDSFLNERVKQHERIHFQQALWMGVIPFYIWYVVEYLIRLIGSGFNHKKAYSSISFEEEAYRNSGWLSGFPKARTRFFSNRPIYKHLNYI